MTVSQLQLFLKTENVESSDRDDNFLGRREKVYISGPNICGKRDLLKYMNTEPDLFPFTHESSPAKNGETICPRCQVGRNGT